MYEGCCEVESLLHTSRIEAGALVRSVYKIDNLEKVIDSLFDCGSMHLLQLSLKHKILTARKILVNYCIMILHSDNLSNFRGIRVHVESGDRGKTRCLLKEGCEYIDGRALSSAVRTQETEELSFVNSERDSLNGLGPVAIGLDEL